MADHAELIRQRGGIRPLARALGHRNPSTVQGWWERKRIPDEHLPAVAQIAPADRPAEQANAA